jgi:glucosamine--fructose-6-phosphate aminotransferase (isomerizing)
MCGIVAVLRGPVRPQAPNLDEVLAELGEARARLDDQGLQAAERLTRAADHLDRVDRSLNTSSAVMQMLLQPSFMDRLEREVSDLEARVLYLEEELFQTGGTIGADLERTNSALIDVKDGLWAIRRDRLRAARQVRSLLQGDPRDSTVEALCSIQTALNGLDRLEVRGRDSAGLTVMVWDHGLDPAMPELKALISGRMADPLFRSCTVRLSAGVLSFVYKAAAEIGELGDNVAALTRAITTDDLLMKALAAENAKATVLGHTRWASVGTISEPNAHPLDGLEVGAWGELPHVVGVLNGDIDNYPELVVREELGIPASITTDAKVIPILIARGLRDGYSTEEAFARAVQRLEGSMAIAAIAAGEPDRLLLAVQGSGQGLYVGLAQDAFVVASEPYGVIERTKTYLRINGDSSAGRLVLLDGSKAGRLEGVDRRRFGLEQLPVGVGDLQEAEITTRDIDRRDFPHFLLKEITEAPESFQKTLRGRVVERDGRPAVVLDKRALPEEIKVRMREGSVRRIVVVGQGTAAVAGQAVAAWLSDALRPKSVVVYALPATELSGFWLQDEMSDTMVVAISQSGTTTDTNRTVDLARARGAAVLAILNRRNTELGEKAHGVVFTSDGRDVEMSVASTKAFYSQIAAGFLLSIALAEAAGCLELSRSTEQLKALLELPAVMKKVLDQRDLIAGIAAQHAPRRRHWAVVGSGPNQIAAEEVRIKLSELCYKSVASDATENKKHIDLSSEPLILVCAAGLSGPNAEDSAKEVSIYRAHKAAPVVVATSNQVAFADCDIIPVPAVHPDLAFILSAMAGHLFGYEAALAIDAQAHPLRLVRAAIQELAAEGHTSEAVLARLGSRIEPAVRAFLDAVADGACDGVAKVGDVLRLSVLLRCAVRDFPFEVYELERGLGAGPGTFLDDLLAGLTVVIDDLTRPIDAVKHQAKTVTVGISRSEDELFQVSLVKEVLRLGLTTEDLGYRAVRNLAALDPAIVEVTGFTRYEVVGGVSPDATIHVIDRGGIAAGISSRTEQDPSLRGTKRAALEKGEVEVTIGRSDGRPVVLIPERKGDTPSGLTLLHLRFKESLPADLARKVLTGYRAARYEALVAAVTETEAHFADEVLGTLSMPELLVEPVLTLAERWRRRDA